MEKEKIRVVANTEFMKRLWDACEIQTLVLASLLLQFILTIFGSRRRYYPGISIRLLVWSSYLMAGWVSTVGLGKLTEINNEPFTYDVHQYPNKKSGVNNSLRGLWAPLILVHLGGPDTITAYAVEDCKLGLRQFVDLAIQIGIVVLILVKSWSNSWLSFITLPLFLVGIIKNGERVWAIKSAISDEIVVDSLLENKCKREPPEELISYHRSTGKVPYFTLLENAHLRFDRLKPHLENWVGHPLASRGLPSVDFYSAVDVFTLAEIELAFMYDMLYTKASINYSRISFCHRIICFLCLVSAFSGFSILFKDADVHLVDVTVLISSRYDKNVDIIITYVLLGGAVLLEIYAVMKLCRSDWAILCMMHAKNNTITKLFLKIVTPKSPRRRRRWSHTMEQLNLLQYCLYDEHSKFGKLISKIPMKFEMDGQDYKDFKKIRLRRFEQVSEDLMIFIVRHIRSRNSLINPFQLVHRPGQQTLMQYNCLDEMEWSLLPLTGNTQASKQNNFGRVITLWHIATDVCYHSEHGSRETLSHALEKISRVLSDYMMYLLATRPSMLSVATGNLIFQGVCEQVKLFSGNKSSEITELCRSLVEAVTEEENVALRANSMTSNQQNRRSSAIVMTANWEVISHVQKLAKSLLQKEKKWEIISNVWVELLCYAATKCPWNLHAQQLRRGGELITHVWLLVAHKIDKLNIGIV